MRSFAPKTNDDATVSIVDDDGIELVRVMHGYRKYSALETAEMIIYDNKFLRINRIKED